MKKVLLGTTALVSAGLVAQQAQAADPIEIGISGYQNWAMFLANNDDNPATGTLPAEPGFNKGDHDIKFIGELHFRGKTVLDNGLEVGVRFELEGETNNDQMDETYVYVTGSFGTIQLGNNDPASYELATAAPYLNYLFNANSPSVFTNGLSQFFAQTTGLIRSRFSAGAYATFATFPNQSFDDAQIMYFSPVFNGFQFGMSYKPDNGEARDGDLYLLNVNTGPASSSPAFTHAAVYSVGARYDGAVGDLGLTVAAGWMNMEHKSISNATLAGTDSQAWNAGLVLYWGNWGVGGSYLRNKDWHNVDGTDTYAYDLGIAYWSDGPWSVGVNYMSQNIDYAAGNLVAAAVKDKFRAYRIQSQYALGPGIRLTGALGLDQFKDGVVSRTYESKFIGTGILVSF
jgi:outer membrane protein OmpU